MPNPPAPPEETIDKRILKAMEQMIRRMDAIIDRNDKILRWIDKAIDESVGEQLGVTDGEDR